MSMNPSEPDGLDAMLNVRLTVAEKQQVAIDAKFTATTMSEVTRARLCGYPLVAAVDYEMINMLRKATGLLKHVHLESNGAYSEDTRAAINALKALAESIVEKKKSTKENGAGR